MSCAFLALLLPHGEQGADEMGRILQRGGLQTVLCGNPALPGRLSRAMAEERKQEDAAGVGGESRFQLIMMTRQF